MNLPFIRDAEKNPVIDFLLKCGLWTVIFVLTSVFLAMTIGFGKPILPVIKFGIVFGMYMSVGAIMLMSIKGIVKMTKLNYINESAETKDEVTQRDSSLLRCMAKTGVGMLERVIIYASYFIVTIAVMWILGNMVDTASPTLITLNGLLDMILWWVYRVQVWVLSIGNYSTMDWLHFYLFVLAVLLTYTVLVFLFVLALFALVVVLFAFVILAVVPSEKVSEAYLKYRDWLNRLVKQE